MPRRASITEPTAFGNMFPNKHHNFSTPDGKPHVHDNDHDSDDNDEGDYYEKKMYFMVVFGLTSTAMLLFLIAAAAPSWAKLPSKKAIDLPLPEAVRNESYLFATPDGYVVNLKDRNVSAVREWRMFGECLCYQTSDEPCSTVRKLFLGGKITSILACCSQFVIAVLLASLYAGFFRKYDRPVHILCCVMSYVGTGALLVTFASFAVAFDRTLCDEVVKSRGVLNWAYGVRATEFAFSAIFTGGITFQTRRRSRRLAKTLLFGQLGVLAFTVLTTTSRGWVSSDSRNYELGLWEGCYCFLNTCNREVAYLQSIQAHVALTIIGLGSFVSIYFLHIPKWIQLWVLGFVLITEIIVLAVFWGWFAEGFCDKESVKEQGFEVQWPVYLPIVVILLTAVVFVAIVLRLKGFFFTGA